MGTAKKVGRTPWSARAPLAPLFGLVMFACGLSAAVVDRVAVVVGNMVITEGEVQQEVRLTEFLNGEPLDLGSKARRDAAERLVDQELIRNEMKIGQYPQPTDADVESTLRQFRQERYGSVSPYRAALAKYGITEEQLKEHIRWQLSALRFTDIRFQPGLDRTAASGNTQTANRLRAGADAPAGNGVDEQMDAWLKETRGNTKIAFKPGAFQ